MNLEDRLQAERELTTN